MELLIQLHGIKKAKRTINSLIAEVPNMYPDYYIRNAIRILG